MRPGAEATARAALRQDMIDGARSDHMAEPWTGVTQRDVSLETARLAVAVTDAHARFGVSRLAARNLADAEMFVRIARANGLSRNRAVAIGALVAATGPVTRLSDLGRLGVSTDDIAALRPFVDALPDGGGVNLNTAPAALLGAMLASPMAVIGAEVRKITAQDFDRVGVAQAAEKRVRVGSAGHRHHGRIRQGVG